MPADVLPFRASLAEPSADTGQVVPLVVDAKRLASLLSVSIRTIRKMDASGKLPAPIRIGGRVVWRIDEIRAWLDCSCPDREVWTLRRATVRK